MSIVLYDRSLPEYPALGTAVFPLGERAHSEREPSMGHRVDATFGERAVLLGYDVHLITEPKPSLRLQCTGRPCRGTLRRAIPLPTM
jgi:hypothetical protein